MIRTSITCLTLWLITCLAPGGIAQPGSLDWVRYQASLSSGYETATFDEARDRIVMFGGDRYDQTWERRVDGWILRRPATVPSARSDAGIAFDALRRKVVMFGGFDQNSTVFLGDTWEWDGDDWTLRATTGPQPQVGAAMAYDSRRGRTVLFGRTQAHQSETWEWDGTTWRQRGVPGNPPVFYGSMAYDPRRGRVVLAGDRNRTFQTWEWDGVNWHRMSPATTIPSWREEPHLVWSPSHGAVLMYGGHGAWQQPSNELWSWDGTDWSLLSPGGLGEPFADDPVVLDAVRGRVLLLSRGLAHELRGSTWVPLDSPTAPAAPFGSHSMCTDTLRGRVVLLGLSGHMGLEWDGSVWHPLASRPSRTFVEQAVAFDRARGVVVTFGGRLTTSHPPTYAMMLWDGSTWSFGPMPRPPSRRLAAMSYDVAAARCIMFGGDSSFGSFRSGQVFADTWEWDGTRWNQITQGGTNVPPARSGHAMAYDEVRGETVMFGGRSSLTNVFGDTWRYRAGSWTQAQPMNQPPARHATSLSWDPDLGALVLHGGFDTNSNPLSDTWLWTGNDWQSVASATSAQPRGGHASSWDPNTRSTLVIGGGESSYESPRTLTRCTWLFGPTTRASRTTFGSGCRSGSMPAPELAAPLPFFGNESFALELRAAAQSAPALFVMSPNAVDLPIGGGCSLFVSNPFALHATMTNSFGYAEAPIPILRLPVLRGRSLHAQAFVLDPGAGGVLNPSATARLTLTVGD